MIKNLNNTLNTESRAEFKFKTKIKLNCHTTLTDPHNNTESRVACSILVCFRFFPIETDQYCLHRT